MRLATPRLLTVLCLLLGLAGQLRGGARRCAERESLPTPLVSRSSTTLSETSREHRRVGQACASAGSGSSEYGQGDYGPAEGNRRAG